MCSRYGYYEKALDETESLAAIIKKGVYEVPFGEIGPVDNGVILRGEKDSIKADVARFGWLGSDNRTLLINARSETIKEKSTFSKGFERHRCVIPVNEYFEWNLHKEKASFASSREDVLFLAGICDVRGNMLQFTVLTRDADEVMKPVHDRMPVLVSRDAIGEWIFDQKSAEQIMGAPQEELVRNIEYEQLSFI